MASFQDGARGANSQEGRQKGRPGNARVQLSKRLTFALRHGANELGLRMRPDGFVRLNDLLSNRRFSGVSRSQVEDVVSSDEKGRMTLLPDEQDGELLIRANQGHSVKGLVDEEQLLTKIASASEVPVCVHGTFPRNWPSIRREGLRCMNRTHMHFAAGLPGEAGVISGMRKSCKVLIYVDVAAAMSDGVVFFRSSNNVILTSGQGGTLSPSYFSRVDGVSDFSLKAKSPAAPERQPARQTLHGTTSPAPVLPRPVDSQGASDISGTSSRGKEAAGRMRRPEKAHAAIPCDDDRGKTPNASASGDRGLPGLLNDSNPSTERRETPAPPKRPNRRRKKGAAAATGHPQANGAINSSTSASGDKEPELGTQAKDISTLGDKGPEVGKPGGGGGGTRRGGGVLPREQEAGCGGLVRSGSSPGEKGPGGCEGRNGEAESDALGEREADEVDVYAVLDFEATCEDRSIDGGRFGPAEVIEFPTVLLDARSLEVLDEFRAYVRPVKNPKLTPFCTGLTGIQQATVDGAVLFKEALHQHTEFLRRHSCLPGQERSCLFITCGNWDLKTMLPTQCKLIGTHVPAHLKSWANIKDVFRKHAPPLMSHKRGGRSRPGVDMVSMLLRLGLVLEGRHHSGLDDCRNIAKLARELCRLSGSRIRATTTDCGKSR